MRLKDLIIRNSVIFSDDSQEVVKRVETPFLPFTRAWSRHEADCLSELAELGYPAAPKLISVSGNGFSMRKIDGQPLSSGSKIDDHTFMRLLDVVSQLHGHGFAHANLCPRNILITPDGAVMLIDFETCCRRGNPLFRLARFSDWVRLHLLWHSSVAPVMQGAPLGFFPKRVVWAMHIIAPVDRCARGIQGIKRRARRALRHYTTTYRRRVPLPDAAETRHGEGPGGDADGQ
jgi:hypothetical protein